MITTTAIGEGLFVVLNTNNYNVAEHQKTIEEAVKAYPDAKWRIVTIHQDIYGSVLTTPTQTV